MMVSFAVSSVNPKSEPFDVENKHLIAQVCEREQNSKCLLVFL